ncbi:MAG: hypothetical protein UHW60_04605 [Methanobrevibacter sp.]|nr:hypothetical protein [Methanobrevibacter sp.]MEE3491149.1 hypothetical protein [Methanobrevibacter sp.]
MKNTSKIKVKKKSYWFCCSISIMSSMVMCSHNEAMITLGLGP